jgi:LPS-assembly lipoprotein
MWWSRRQFVLSALALGACGFTPVYGPFGDAQGLDGQIAIDPPRDADGFAYVRHLETRLGLADVPRYQLGTDLYVTEEELGITPDQTITRYQLIGRARFTLTEIATGTVATSGEVHSFTSYSATGTPFATETAKRDARERLVTTLGDLVVARLLATSGDWR